MITAILIIIAVLFGLGFNLGAGCSSGFIPAMVIVCTVCYIMINNSKK